MPERPNQRAVIFLSDFAQPAEVSLLVKKIKDLLPRLDALINNAAIQGPIRPLVKRSHSLDTVKMFYKDVADAGFNL